ncbi:hypothetical protein HIM_07719 [Hirsutella minnesotensis 3608]|uniref:SMP-30/Gluconolactonase/LRE-like region domain-containing protein n=1 Tax=Hirsutella minnesotensis 3608 TaxID=1043627 RepID=A0A0F7ZHN6_9HYPO|nr:hypothetical protein HIM_07719 [Hirsutella minnesotensis 3608]
MDRSPESWVVQSPWLDMQCGLGEWPFYEKATNSIRFVDIIKKQLHSVSLTEGVESLQTVQLDVRPTVTSDIQSVDPREKILLGVKYGIAVLDRRSGTYDMLARFQEPDNERIRGNDGASDPLGGFWLGTMTDFSYGDLKPEASPFSAEIAMAGHRTGLTIPNSGGWSPDRKTMYFAHTKERHILAWDYDSSFGAPGRERLFYQHNGPGGPDGFRIDVDGNLWSAVYGQGLVLKLSPKGEELGRIKLPARNISCVQFAGTELVITSAADDSDDADPTSKRFGGAVFKLDVGIRGLDLFEFRMGLGSKN